MYKAVLFDLDGTIVDSSEGILKSAKEALSVLGIEIPPDDEIRSCIGPPIGETLEKIVGFSQSEKKRFYEIFRSVYKDKYLYQCSLYSGMIDLLNDLKKRDCYLGIATNKRIDTTKLLLDHLGIADSFDTVVAQDQNEIRKKSDMILNVLSNLKVDRGDAVMIGDSQNDLDAAKCAGVSFIGVRYGFGFKEPMEEEIELADSVDDLRGSLLR